MTYNSHVKSSVLKRIIQSDTPCEEKLTQLSTLVGVPAPTTSNEESGNAVVPPNESSGGDNEERPEINERNESYKRILSGLTPKEKRNGKYILLRIESSPNLSWDYKTDVLMIDGEPQLHSNFINHRSMRKLMLLTLIDMMCFGQTLKIGLFLIKH